MISFYALIFLVFGLFNNIILWFLIFFFTFVGNKKNQATCTKKGKKMVKIEKEASCDGPVGHAIEMPATANPRYADDLSPSAMASRRLSCGPLFACFCGRPFSLFIALSWDF